MYIPKSQIIDNQFTNGNELVRSDNGKNYTGFYWQDSRGRIFSGKNPSDVPTISLNAVVVDSTEEPAIVNNKSTWLTDYNRKITSDTPGTIPVRYTPKPSDDAYDIGEFQRYFTKKTNQNIYFEISDKDYKRLSSKDSTVAWQIYQAIELPWQISGDKQTAYTVNRNIVLQTERQDKLPGFNKIFREDYLQYYKD